MREMLLQMCYRNNLVHRNYAFITPLRSKNS